MSSRVDQLTSDVGIITHRFQDVRTSNEWSKGIEERVKNDMSTLAELRAGLSSMLASCKDELRKAQLVSDIVTKTKEEVVVSFKTVQAAHEELRGEFEIAKAASEQAKTGQALILEALEKAQNKVTELEESSTKRMSDLEKSSLVSFEAAEEKMLKKLDGIQNEMEEKILAHMTEAAKNIELTVLENLKSEISLLKTNTESEINQYVQRAISSVSNAQQGAIMQFQNMKQMGAKGITPQMMPLSQMIPMPQMMPLTQMIPMPVIPVTDIVTAPSAGKIELNEDENDLLRRADIRAAQNEKNIESAAQTLKEEEMKLAAESREAETHYVEAKELAETIVHDQEAQRQLMNEERSVNIALKRIEEEALKHPNSAVAVAHLQDAQNMSSVLHSNIEALGNKIVSEEAQYEQLATKVAREGEEIEKHLAGFRADQAVYAAAQNDLIADRAVIEEARILKNPYPHTMSITGAMPPQVKSEAYAFGAPQLSGGETYNRAQKSLCIEAAMMALRDANITPRYPNTKSLYDAVIAKVSRDLEKRIFPIVDNEYIEKVAEEMN
jgi:hypothetical protein